MTWTTRQRCDFGSLKAIKQGEGAPLLLLHGVGLRAEAWNKQIDALANGCTVIAPDMPGHGETPLQGTTAQISAYTDRVVDALSGPVLVAGHSMGALIALDLAVRYPASVIGVAALNAVFKRKPDAKKAVEFRAANLLVDRQQDPEPTLSRWFDDLNCDEAIACRNWLTTVDPNSYKQAYSIFAKEDGPSKHGLSKLQMPALFMTGSREPNSTPAMSAAMAALAPKGQAVVVADAKHMMPMTHSRVVNTNLLQFFKECS